MSNTSTNNDKTVGDDAKVKLIIGEIGRDTKTGIIGRGYSFDNGNTFHVTDTIFGRLYDDRDADGIWNNGMHEKVKEKVNQEITNTVEPAIKQADSAVAYANDAIEKSRVNQQAIAEINSAVSDAVSDAAVARSDGLRAWDAAQSNVDLIDSNYASASAAISSARTEAIAAADEAKASASAAQADIVAVRSDVAAVQADVTATKSDVAVARAGAQSDVAAVRADVTATKSDVAAIRADVTASKSDAAVVRAGMASDVAAVQADVMSNKSDISAMRADVASDIAAVRADAKALTNQIADITSNGGGRNLFVGSIPIDSHNLNGWSIDSGYVGTHAFLDDGATKMFVLQNSTTKENFIWSPYVSLENGETYTLSYYAFATINTMDSGEVYVANGKETQQIANSKKLSESHAVRYVYTFVFDKPSGKYRFRFDNNGSNDGKTASMFIGKPMLEKGTVAHDWSPSPEDTNAAITAAKNEIAAVKTNLASQAASLSSYAAQASAAGQDITVLKSQAGQFEQEMADTKGDVSQLKVSASSASAALSDAAGNISSLQASAKSYSAALSDTNSNVATVTATANELETKYADAAGDINKLQTDAKGTTQALTNAKSDIAVLQSRADGFDAEFVSANGNINKLQMDAKGTAQTLVDAKDDIAKLKVRADGFDTEFANTSGDINKLQADAKGTTQTLADAQDDIAKLKIRADGFDTQFSSTNGDINKLQTDASGTKQTLTNAKSDIAVLQSRADGYDTKFADTAGDISTLQASAKSYSAALSDTNSNVATVTATASELETKYADAAGDISQIKTDAKGTAETIADAQGNIASLKKRADGFDMQFTNAKSDIAVIQSDATGTKETLTNAKSDIAVLQSRADGFDAKYADVAGDVSTLQADAKGMTQTISNAQGDIAKLKTRADGFDTEFANTSGDISKLQTDAKGTTQTLTNAKSDIAVLQSRADGYDTKFADTAGDINKLQVDASGMKQTLTDAQGNISTLQATATGFKNTLTDAQGNISKLQSDVAGLKKTTSDHAGNIATLQADAKTLTSQMSSAQGDISTLKQTASGFSSQVSGMETSLANANSKLDGITSNGGGRNLLVGSVPTDINNLNGWSIDSGYVGTHAFLDDGATKMFVLQNSTTKENFLWSPYVSLENGETYTLSYYAFATINTMNSGEVYVTTNDYSETQSIAPPKKLDSGRAIRYVYTFAFSKPSGKYRFRFDNNGSSDGKQSAMYIGKPMLEKGIVAHDWSPAPEDADAKITANSTAIEQNKKAITLKADQTTVDKTNGTVQLLQAQLKVQADQIKSKVSSLDLQNLVGEGGRNLLQGTRDFSGISIQGDKVAVTNGGDKFQAATGTGDPSQVYFDLVCFYGIPLEKDTDYTASFWVKTSEDTDIWSYLFNSGSNGNYADGATVNHSTTDYTRIIVHFHNGNNSTTLNFIPVRINKKSTITVWVYGCMLEKGMIAHDWQSAPEDVQTYTQTQIKQTADSWNANLTSVKDGLTQSYTNLHATVDGIQAQVYNKDGSSRITQLSNLIATKVSQGDYNTQIIQLKNAINLRVSKGNVVSQINQEAGGNTLIQVANGQGKLALNASSVIFSGSAFIPDAYITTLNADKLRFYDSSGNVATMSAGLEQYDDDKANKTIVLQYSGGYEVHASDLLGSILTMHDNTIRLAVKANGMASSGNVDQYSGVYVGQHYAQLSCYRSNGSAPGIYITDDGYTIKGDDSGNGTKWGDLYIVSPQVHVRGSNAVQMQVNKTHAWLSDGMFHLYKDGDSSSTATKLQVDGWAWVNGFVEAAGHSQHSALSTKTDIQSVDDEKMLKMVNDTDLTTFLYKTDIANGETHRHIGLIIDDVHDVAQYQTPQEFIAPNGVSRDDDNMIGALFGAVKALTKRIKTLESKVG